MAPPTHTPQERPVDEVQLKLMEELCIVVSEKDEVIGYDTKKKCHLMTNIKDGLLHRAFSVFLFNSDGKLLLQKRADEKITFPAYWTNTCCSHPLYYMQEGDQSTYSVSYSDELEERDQLGVKRAAQRKLNHELGINMNDVATDDFTFLTRIHYLASSDDIWGEHEVDYVLFLRKDIAVNPNPNEVSAVKYVDQTELKEMIKSAEAGEIKLTPWFSLIKDNFLFKWWDALLKNDIASQVDPTTIHKL